MLNTPRTSTQAVSLTARRRCSTSQPSCRLCLDLRRAHWTPLPCLGCCDTCIPSYPMDALTQQLHVLQEPRHARGHTRALLDWSSVWLYPARCHWIQRNPAMAPIAVFLNRSPLDAIRLHSKLLLLLVVQCTVPLANRQAPGYVLSSRRSRCVRVAFAMGSSMHGTWMIRKPSSWTISSTSAPVRYALSRVTDARPGTALQQLSMPPCKT